MSEELAKLWQGRSEGYLPGELGMQFLEVEHGLVRSRLVVEKRHHAPNDFLHAATVIMLADTSSGCGSMASLPEGATGFTTIELKANFLGTAKPGERVTCEARLVHGGRTTQVWDAEARNETTGKTIALFRCTQMILYPR